MKAIVFAVLATFATSAFAADDMAGIKAINEKFAKAWNKHDVKAMTALFADDADIINPMGRVAKGKAEIEKLFTDEHSTFMKGTTFTITADSMRMVDGLAFIDGTATVMGMKTPDGKKMDKMPHHAFWIAKKVGTNWQILALRPYMFVTPPAGPHGTQATTH